MVFTIGVEMKLRNFGHIIIAAIALLMIGGGVVKAAPIYDTSALGELNTYDSDTPRTIGGGLTLGGGNAAADATLDWVITAMNGYYHYSYDFYFGEDQV